MISNYSDNEILNSDHCPFQKEYISPRTLSFTGERTTEVAARKKNNVTHSYTVQSITSASGQFIGKFLLILQETESEFSKRVRENLAVAPNVVIRAFKSGKSSDEKHHTFLMKFYVLWLIGNSFFFLIAGQHKLI